MNEENSETETKANEELVEEKPKTSKWAKTSFWCGLLGLCLPIIIIIMLVGSSHWLLSPLSYSARRSLEEVLGKIFHIVPPILATIAIVSSVVGLVNIKLKKGAVKGTGKAVAGLICSLSFIAIFVILPYAITYPRFLACKITCGQQLERLGKAMAIYSETNNGKYPAASKWCDLLIEQTDVRGFLFVCKGAREERYHHTINQEDEPNSPWHQIFSYRDPNGQRYYVKRGYYAFNPNTEPNSPDDVVLLFETKGGWNQFGGPELLTTEHHRGKGSNVLFNDGDAEFVKSRDLEKLKWKAEENE